MDFRKLLGDSHRYTLHSHTEFCDGRAQMEAFAREAVKREFSHYGFTPHSPVPIFSTCNMHRDKVSSFLCEVDRIKGEYGDRVCFLAGMEVDFLGSDWGPSRDYFASLPLDYIIGSVHFIPDSNGEQVDIDGRFDSFARKMKKHFNNDIRYVVEKYFEQSIKMVEEGGFDIMGHLDKIGHNSSMYQPGIEDEPWYMSLADELVDRVVEAGLTVELNTKARAEFGRFFPSDRLLAKLLRTDTFIVVNSDAHVPALIDASREEAYALMERLSTQN
ncbi:MAG: histidinol-phosphatase [Clostridiales bacterium]|nr:histidinol-phosphatase [Clostridiales bacterium]